MRRDWLRLLALAAILSPASARSQELVAPGQGRFDVGGYAELQTRVLSDGFQSIDRTYLSQFAWVLDLEPEWNIAPDGFGPFDAISAFARIEVRYECVWTGCGVFDTWRYFGNRATRAPARNWADGLTERFEGPVDLTTTRGLPVRRIQSSDNHLTDFISAQHTARVLEMGVPLSTVQASLGPLLDDLFSFKRLDSFERNGIGETFALPLGPWRPESHIDANGSLASMPSNVDPLPLRPAISSQYLPSAALRRHIDDFDSFDENFSQTDLEWNHGASQDEWELKEAYLDIEMFDSRLWIRIGKQNIVWGKTELFRTTDQFNPVDVGLASLPSLEESRSALWAVRGVWSFYDVGPFHDVRLEAAMNFDDFEPIDLGRCGEPYAVWLVCGKTTALFGHGAAGFGIAGEVKPPDPWDSARGIEFGVRLEWRYNRFSFALTDFYGYDDIPSVELFNEFSRNVDPETGRPLDVYGRPLTPSTPAWQTSANRQFLEQGCNATLGFGSNAALALTGGFGTTPDLSTTCLPDIANLTDPFVITTTSPIALMINATFPEAFGAALAGHTGGNLLTDVMTNGVITALTDFLFNTIPVVLTPLNADPADGPPGGGLFGTGCSLGPLCALLTGSTMSEYLTDEQEALLGCGPFYQTDCDSQGIDVFNSEASVLLQAVAGLEDSPVATRFYQGRLVILPGARGPGDPGYDPLVDGTPPAGYDSEMQALSANFLYFLALAGLAEGDVDCDPNNPETCAAVNTFISISGSQHPSLRAGGNGRYGRRDFLWHSGGEALLFYPKRNVFGLSFDFAEDFFKTSWGVEFTWVNDTPFADNMAPDLLQKSDVFNLTISVDRPTFVNFLNANRTFFLNTQVFLRYLPDYDRSYDVNGPLTALATFAITTGYFQDRMLPTLVFVHDFKSRSGGIISQVSYRFTESASVTFGVLGFYGKPQNNRYPLHPIVPTNLVTTDTDSRTRYEGLSIISERDEMFMVFRYTF